MTVSKTSAAAATPRGFRMPTAKELQAAYKSIVDARMKDGHLKPMARPPANFSKYPSYDISGGKLGVGRVVYAIKGELYLKTQVVAPGAKAVWYKTGPAPLF